MGNSKEDMLNKFKVNIISWYDFKKTDSILLIGNIDKTIVSFLCKKFKKVTYKINSEFQKEEIYKISNNYKNLKFTEKYFFNNEKFDYVFLMNYFNNSNEEVIKFINNISNFMLDDGKVLAIFKNRIGAREIAKNSFEGYSKIRLENIIKNSKYKFSKFYYVLPNEEYTNIIFSDEYLPTETDMRRNLEFSETPTNIGFAENEILIKILKEYKNDFKILANSFFVELSQNDFINNVKAVFYSNIRNEKYQIRTKILDGIAIKEPVYESGKEHLSTIKNNVDILNKSNINTLDNYDENKIISKFAVNHERLDDVFLKYYRVKDLKYKDVINKFKNEILFKLEKTTTKNNVFEKLNINVDSEILNKFTFVKYGLWDLTIQNTFLINNELYVYDQEWCEENIPLEFILYRSILHGFEILSEEEKDKLYKEFGVYEFKGLFYELEVALQNDITNEEMLDLYKNTLYQTYDSALNVEKNNLLEEKNKLLIQKNVLEKEVKNQDELINSKKMIVSNLISKQDELDIEKNNLINEVALKDNKINELQVAISSSKALKYTRGAKKAIKSFLKKITNIFKKPIRFLYGNVFSKKTKRKLKEKAEYSKNLSKMLGIPMIHEYNNTMELYNKKDETYQDVLSQFKLEKSIGIHLYLSCDSLANEYYKYLSNIPYIFDLYVLVKKETNINNIEKIFSRIVNLNYLEIKITENAKIVPFSEKLNKYDYLINIYSKSEEQFELEKYLLDNLLGNSEFIMKEFYLMEKLNCGLVYPDSYNSFSINSYVWLDEKELAKKVMEKIGIEFRDEFLEFPNGGIFLAKKDALKQLLDLNLQEYFEQDKEKSENVFEKILGTITRYNNYNIAIYNSKENKFLLNYGSKGADNYFKYTSIDYINILKDFDVVSFDIFDTLITKKIFNQEDIFLLIDKKINKGNIKIDNFVKIRKETEEKISKENSGIYTINEIYSEFKNITSLEEKQVLEIKNIEIETIKELCISRKEILKIYNEIINCGKEVVFICDTYLPKDVVQEILDNCGYKNYNNILLSSETNLSKLNGDIYNNLFYKYPNSKIIHLGNDEQYDINILKSQNRPNLYVASTNRLLELSNYKIGNVKFDLANSVLFGLIYNKSLFNSPFALNNSKIEPLIKTLFDLGYSIFGPIILDYILNLIKYLKCDSRDKVLLFASREGYYLQKIFDDLKIKLEIKELENLEEHYLIISKRIIETITIENIDDVYKLFEIEYSGTIKEILYEKIGYMGSKIEDKIINLPNDFDIIKNVIAENYEEIVKQIKYEKNNYINYIKSLSPDIYEKDIVYVDFEFKESYKNCFSKFMNKEIIYKYYENLDDVPKKFLNKFLISHSSNIKFIDENLNLHYTFENNAKARNYSDEIYNGIIELINDMIGIYGKDLSYIEIDKNIIKENYKNFCKETDKLLGDVKKFYSS